MNIRAIDIELINFKSYEGEEEMGKFELFISCSSFFLLFLGL